MRHQLDLDEIIELAHKSSKTYYGTSSILAKDNFNDYSTPSSLLRHLGNFFCTYELASLDSCCSWRNLSSGKTITIYRKRGPFALYDKYNIDCDDNEVDNIEYENIFRLRGTKDKGVKEVFKRAKRLWIGKLRRIYEDEISKIEAEERRERVLNSMNLEQLGNLFEAMAKPTIEILRYNNRHKG